ncbi:MAG: isoleucine--tRNA ligase [Elusimicrobiota bacterium]|nr:isoleucine--tRNA ligase [Endomicrobiia bacterium]MDW8166217.1 isoleucine--tRNA ligase [Elusimicrobiota bacterium]
MCSVDYSKTVNLPKTNFPMKANLSQREPAFIKFWQENRIYQKILEKNKESKKVFILHDGPPYANGHIHIGHALNKILKDIVVKYKALTGHYTPFIPGWDCHGLPIEYQLFKELKITKEQISQIEFRKKAKEYAQKYVEIQKEEFIRLGVFANWQNPYLTMSKEYEAEIIDSLMKLVEEGYLTKRKKPVYWCIHCETSLAEAEVEYEDKISDSIYVKFPVFRSSVLDRFQNLSILIWTTTPWTLPSNLALAIRPDEKYVIIRHKDEYYLIMKKRLEEIENTLDVKLETIEELYGYEIAKEKFSETTVCKHPFLDRFSYCIPYENVSTEEGTGVIHIAPGHGDEDYLLGIKFNLDIYSPVDSKGKFEDKKIIDEIPSLYNKNVFEANSIIIKHLEDVNMLVHSSKIKHSYPHCWRCKNPVIFRATEQWFLLIDHKNLRQRLLENVKKVKWIPEFGENRISSMLEVRPDWCLSRQRYWGVPIPALYCKNCKEVYITLEILKKVKEIFQKEGSDSWFIRDIKDFLPKDFKCRCGSQEFTKETDILDVWYDSSVSYRVLNKLELKNLKEVMYLEGSDQHRGWFQVSLITSTATQNKAPYDIVLTHGFVVDGEGRKMSKSLGNVVSPQDVIKHHGAEILRLWSASSDYSLDVRISEEILQRLIETYRKIRNTIRYILGNLYDFKVSYKEYQLDFLDKYILSKLSGVVEELVVAYDEFKFYKVVNLINNFFIKDLSNFYFDVLKDKFYTYKRTSPERTASQFVLYKIFTTLLPFLSPILSFTSEEAWQEARNNNLVEEESVFLCEIDSVLKDISKYRDIELEKEVERILEIREKINLKIEELRKSSIIGSSLEAKVILKVNPNKEYKQVVDKYSNKFSSVFIVSKVIVEYPLDMKESIEVEVEKFDGIKCPRCWIYYDVLTEYGVCEKCKEALIELGVI